jgi:hydrogenase maturation factor
MKNPASDIRKMMLTFVLAALVGVVPQLSAQTVPQFTVNQIAEDPDLTAGAPLPFLFAIGTDNQVWVHEFDGFGDPYPPITSSTQVGGYMLIPNQVKAISVGHDSAGKPLLFVIGTDNQVWVHQFYGSGNPNNPNGTGHPIGGYMPIPNQVKAISVGRDGAGNPLLYVIGTDNQVYVHQFDGSGNPVGGYMLIPNQVKAISVGRDSAGNPLLYVIGTDNQIWVHRFDGSGNPVGGYMLIPNQVKAISVGRDSAGKPLLWVIGTDNQVYVHQFDGSGNPVGSYVLVRYGISLDFIEQLQQQSLWCWDATTVSITQYYDPATTWTQGNLADHVFGQTTCSTNGGSSLCNRGSDLGADLTTTNHLSSSFYGPATLDQVMGEIQASRPIGITIQWNGGGEHDLVIDGFDFSDPSSPTIHVQDPWYGPATQNFNTFPSQYWGGATWFSTYLTK